MRQHRATSHGEALQRTAPATTINMLVPLLNVTGPTSDDPKKSDAKGFALGRFIHPQIDNKQSGAKLELPDLADNLPFQYGCLLRRAKKMLEAFIQIRAGCREAINFNFTPGYVAESL